MGSSLDNRSATAWDCESFFVTTGWSQAWIYTAERDGELRKKRCPRAITSTVYVQPPVRPVNMAILERLEATAQALAEARTRQEVVEALESQAKVAETGEAAGNR